MMLMIDATGKGGKGCLLNECQLLYVWLVHAAGVIISMFIFVDWKICFNKYFLVPNRLVLCIYSVGVDYHDGKPFKLTWLFAECSTSK